MCGRTRRPAAEWPTYRPSPGRWWSDAALAPGAGAVRSVAPPSSGTASPPACRSRPPRRWRRVPLGGHRRRAGGGVARPQRHQLPADLRRRRADRLRRVPDMAPDPLHRRPQHGARRSCSSSPLATAVVHAHRRVELAVHVLPPADGDAGRLQPRLRLRRPPHPRVRRHRQHRSTSSSTPPARRTASATARRGWRSPRSWPSPAAWPDRCRSESARQQSLALDRLGRLAEANALLFSLHRVAQTLPASLDLDEVLDSSITRLRDLIDFDSVTVLLYEESDGIVGAGAPQGQPRPAHPRHRDAPRATASAPCEARGTVHEPVLAAPAARAWRRRAASGPLLARCGPAARRSASSPSSPTRPTATAPRTSSSSTDWSSRSASPSTTPDGSPASARSAPTRSAPASPATSTTRSASPSPTSASSWTGPFAVTKRSKFQPVLDRSARPGAHVVKEVRETLYDLRTDVSDVQDVGTTMQIFCDRVHERSGLDDPHRAPRDRPAAAPAGAGAVADRQGGGHERRASRRGLRCSRITLATATASAPS